MQGELFTYRVCIDQEATTVSYTQGYTANILFVLVVLQYYCYLHVHVLPDILFATGMIEHDKKSCETIRANVT